MEGFRVERGMLEIVLNRCIASAKPEFSPLYSLGRPFQGNKSGICGGIAGTCMCIEIRVEKSVQGW